MGTIIRYVRPTGSAAGDDDDPVARAGQRLLVAEEGADDVTEPALLDLPAALGWESIAELVLLAIPHLLFINRIRLARIFAASQREQDLERFLTLRRELTEAEGTESTGQAQHGGTETRGS